MIGKFPYKSKRWFAVVYISTICVVLGTGSVGCGRLGQADIIFSPKTKVSSYFLVTLV